MIVDLIERVAAVCYLFSGQDGRAMGLSALMAAESLSQKWWPNFNCEILPRVFFATWFRTGMVRLCFLLAALYRL